MPIDAAFADRFPLIADLRSHEELAADPDKLARYERYRGEPGTYRVPDDVRVEAVQIPGPHGAVPARVYRATAGAHSGNVPVRGADTGTSTDVPAVLWLHGGGWRSGTLDWPESHVVSAELAHRTGAVVVTADYRLAVGGVRFPVPVDDVVAAWDWLTGDRSDGGLGHDAARTTIGGASAGANLALGAVIRLRSLGHALPGAMALAYPAVHLPVPAMSDDTVAAELHAAPEILRFRPDGYADLVSNYVGRTTDIPHEAMPGHADLTALPRAVVVVAEYDDLGPSGDLLVRQLRECGVEVTRYLAAGMLHGHLNREPAGLPEVDHTLDVLAGAVFRG